MDVSGANISVVSPPATGVLDRLESFQIPSQQELLSSLAALEPVYACLLLAGGLACLVHGWKLFKVVVVVNAAIIGVLLGRWLAGAIGDDPNTPMFTAIGGGLLLAGLAWPFMKSAVGLMGALAGGALGLGLWHYAAGAAAKPDLAEHAWAGGLIGLVSLGLLAFVIFRFVVITTTSFQGAAMTVCGLIALLLKYQRVAEPMRTSLQDNVYLMPLVVAVPAIVGFTAQQAAVMKKAKKKKAAEGGG
jgi:hypothetical protein